MKLTVDILKKLTLCKYHNRRCLTLPSRFSGIHPPLITPHKTGLKNYPSWGNPPMEDNFSTQHVINLCSIYGNSTWSWPCTKVLFIMMHNCWLLAYLCLVCLGPPTEVDATISIGGQSLGMLDRVPVLWTRRGCRCQQLVCGGEWWRWWCSRWTSDLTGRCCGGSKLRTDSAGVTADGQATAASKNKEQNCMQSLLSSSIKVTWRCRNAFFVLYCAEY